MALVQFVGNFIDAMEAGKTVMRCLADLSKVFNLVNITEGA